MATQDEDADDDENPPILVHADLVEDTLRFDIYMTMLTKWTCYCETRACSIPLSQTVKQSVAELTFKCGAPVAGNLGQEELRFITRMVDQRQNDGYLRLIGISWEDIPGDTFTEGTVRLSLALQFCDPAEDYITNPYPRHKLPVIKAVCAMLQFSFLIEPQIWVPSEKTYVPVWEVLDWEGDPVRKEEPRWVAPGKK